ncbi:hypothetical protein [Streptococcus equinus]|uniref:phage head spike fiber domain-containing protein n=1 Tax=Streptococcus equinus TaxID=1335 RepID=UPI0015F639AA|nr:hypothetical protein [Streptococcus equinus]QMS96953.1 hypothetical protein H1R75_03510 [Streptococcus equinus]
MKNTKSFTGSNITGQSTILSETYQGCAIRYLKNTNPNSARQDIVQFNNCVYPKLGSEYVASFWAKGSGELSIFFYGDNNYLQEDLTVSSWGESTTRYDGYITLTLTEDWQRYWIKYKLKTAPFSATSVGKHLLFRHNSNSTEDEIYLAGVQLEEGNVVKDYSSTAEELGWSPATLVPTQQQRYLWKFEYVYYSDGSVEVIGPVNLSIAGADANTTGITDAINQTNQTVTSLQNSVSQAQSDLATVSSNLTQARQNLESSIASVNTKAQAVETTLAQVQSTANANSQKTATLENDLDGLSARFSSLKIGAVNLLKNSKTFTGSNITGSSTILDETYNDCTVRYLKSNSATSGYQDLVQFNNCVYPKLGGEYVASFWAKGSGAITAFFHGNGGYLQIASIESSQGSSGIAPDGRMEFTLAENWQRYWVKYKLRTAPFSATSVGKHFLIRHHANGKEEEICLAGCKLEEGNIATDYSPNEADLELKVADYKQTADQNYASLQTTVQNLDGTVTANKATADQTAAGFQARIESLETYKDDESTRANQYFEAAKTETARQLTAERTAIANDYVAKSTYTEDVTGLRNDLTATTTTANTTKTNLASYQASNDQAVASLQSSLQTTDGNVSNLQTQINAVPGQITSAVSAVEGKIPTEIGAVNLLKNTKTFKGSNITGSSTVLSEVYQDCAVRYFKNTNPNSARQDLVQFNNCIYPKLGGEYVASFWAKGSGELSIFFYGDNNYLQEDLTVSSWGESTTRYDGYITLTLTEDWQRYWIKYKLKTAPFSATSVGKHLLFRHNSNSTEDEIYLAGCKLEEGNIVSGYAPNSEDAASQISSLSSELSQTKDGMTLLATKTELNTAKSDLQAGISTATNKADNAQATANSNAQTISTHTTQISALNTGLQSKVSQSDFDSLSGDVDDLSSELTQTASSITASVSSVETKANNAQATANSAVSKANAAQTAVNTLDSEVVKSASLNLDNNGFVTKVGKTIDGNKFATMIAQDANSVKIIADEMQVTADMIVDGAVTANKLNVNNLSAVNSDLGAIKGGSLLLQENKTAGSATDSWGTYNRPAYKQGLFLDNHAFASSGAIQRKNGNETTPTDMPLAVLQAGELRFLVVDYNDNLENVVHYGLSDPDFGAIRFEIDSELKRRLTMTSSGYLNFEATNYTSWQSTGVSGCEYMIQGRLVLVNYDVTFNSAGTHTIGGIPQEFTKKSLMMTAKAWTITPRDKNIQLNSDGSLHILDAEANVNYRGTLVFSY